MFFRETEKQDSLRRPKKHSVQDHACVDAPRLNAQAPSREIIVNMVKSANATVKDIAGRYAQLLQLQCVAQGQVDVWFGPRGGVGNLLHRKACMAEFVVDLLPHFEVLQRYPCTGGSIPILPCMLRKKSLWSPRPSSHDGSAGM